MQQKIVIKFKECSEKRRRKALQTAAGAYGVTSMALQGGEEDRYKLEIVIIGEKVDAAILTTGLRKFLSCVELMGVEQAVMPQSVEEKQPEPDLVTVGEVAACCGEESLVPNPNSWELFALAYEHEYDPPNSFFCSLV